MQPIIYVGSDNLLYLLGLTDQASGTFVTNAAVAANLWDAGRQNQIAGPIALSYVAGPLTVNGNTYADGNYRGQLPASAALSPDTRYLLELTATASGNTLFKRIPLLAEYDEIN